MPNVAGHDITNRQMVALHGLYRGLVQRKNGAPTVYGTNVRLQLSTLATRGIIARSGHSYIIPFGSPGAAIIAASPDFQISQHI